MSLGSDPWPSLGITVAPPPPGWQQRDALLPTPAPGTLPPAGPQDHLGDPHHRGSTHTTTQLPLRSQRPHSLEEFDIPIIQTVIHEFDCIVS